MKTSRMSRRTLLRGLGGITIGLPLLDEMLVSRAVAAPMPKVPVRAFNVFFGLGIPAPLQNEGYEGVLEPLKPLADQVLILRQVDQVRCDENGINAHYDGSCGAFTAEPPRGEARAGGASIDQMVRHAHHPDGMPSGMVPTLVAGTYFRRDDRACRYVHSFNADGTVAAAMQEKPRDLFDRVFGSIQGLDDADAKQARFQRSVLDSVVDQYRYLSGQRSPLGSDSKRRLADHLERVRELEQRAYAQVEADPRSPKVPPRSNLPHGGAADPSGEGIDITLEELTKEWRLMAELYAMAIQTDRARFGSITFLSAGERIRLKGEYTYNGRKVWQFDDAAQHNASGSAGCSHEWWHKFNEKQKNEQLRAHAHMKMREVAYFLQLLHGEQAREANGLSILENSLFTISTESGDGRHNDPKRELSGVFHAVTGANKRFKTGQILDVGHEALDVYNSLLRGMGSEKKLGPTKRDDAAVDSIRA